MYALQTKGRIRVGVLDADAPFAATDASGAHAGFEVDLARELAKAIFGARPDPDAVIEWISVDRSTALSALTSAQADVVLARLAATTERAAVIDQTDPYFVTGERQSELRGEEAVIVLGVREDAAAARRGCRIAADEEHRTGRRAERDRPADPHQRVAAPRFVQVDDRDHGHRQLLGHDCL